MSGGFSIDVPFVTVASVGGPHDDLSYVCGFEVARLDAELGLLGTVDGDLAWTPDMPYHRTNVPQIDLGAMGHGFTVTEVGGDAEWVYLRFERRAGGSSD